jgi:2-keto-3-deoxy-6-phosphogluconate aldolase
MNKSDKLNMIRETGVIAIMRAHSSEQLIAAADAIKAGGEKYLPRLDSQTPDEFVAYLARASFFNATAAVWGVPVESLVPPPHFG